MRKISCLTLALMLLVGGISVVSAQAQRWKPDKHVELVVPFAAGANADRLARAMQTIWSAKQLIQTTSAVVNKGGGGGAVGWLYMSQHAKDPHYVAIGSATLLTNHIIGTGQLNYTDFTPIATLLNESTVFAVKADSVIKSGHDLIERLRADPRALSISVGSALGNSNHIALALVAKAVGIDPKRLKVVAFGPAGAAMTALLGGHVDVAVSSLGVFVPQVEAGKLHVVAVGSPQRLSGAFATVPTWKEQGIAARFGSWRVMLGTKGITNEQVAFWEEVIARLDKTEEWQAMARSLMWELAFKGSRDTRESLDADYAILKAVLTDLGMAK